ncbi:apolipophorins-like [Arctopsyche grandis]|uniref:apolipophorins-like n=1 Tax=Arctopsyche grandis TaxID=121162 RepID=UPI00406D99C5
MMTVKSSTNNSLDENIVMFDADVEIYADDTCNLVLKLESPTFTDTTNSSNSPQLSNILSTRYLLFRYEQGEVTEVCSSKSDPDWVINIKLGILSALQYTWRNDSFKYNATETNMNGDCESQYTINEADGWRILRRDVDLNGCTQRTIYRKKFFNLHNNLNASKVDEFSKSFQKCRHVLGKNGEPILITCREFHSIKPFPNATDINVKLKQQLDLDRIVIKDIPNFEDEYTSNEYQYAYTFDYEEIEKNSANLILNLIQSWNKTLNEKLYDLIRIATYDELKTPLLQDEAFTPLAYLYISGLINNYCQENSNCTQETEIKNVIKQIEFPLQLSIEIDNYESVLISLVSLENIGFTYSIDSIISIYQNKTLPKILRLAALRSHGQMECQDVRRDLLFEVFANQDDEASVRLEAYLAVMKCPSYDVFKKTLHVLLNEHINQVTLFTWNYLSQLQNTSSKFKNIIDLLLNDNHIKWKYEWNDENNDIPIDSHLFSISSNESSNVITIRDRTNIELEMFKTKKLMNIFNKTIEIFGFDGYLLRIKPISKSDYIAKKKLCSFDYTKNDDVFQQKENSILNKEIIDSLHQYLYFSVLGTKLYTLNLSSWQKQLEDIYKDPDIISISPLYFKFQQNVKILDVSYIASTTTGLPLTVNINVDLNIAMNTTINMNQSDWSMCDFDPKENSYLKTSTMVKSFMMVDSFYKKISIDSFEVINNEVV